MKIETSDITMFQGLALVKLVKPRTMLQDQIEVSDRKEGQEEAERKIVKKRVRKNVQTVEVVNVDPTNALKVIPGDLVLVDNRRLRDFDLYKNLYLIQVYEIMGRVAKSQPVVEPVELKVV